MVGVGSFAEINASGRLSITDTCVRSCIRFLLGSRVRVGLWVQGRIDTLTPFYFVTFITFVAVTLLSFFQCNGSALNILVVCSLISFFPDSAAAHFTNISSLAFSSKKHIRHIDIFLPPGLDPPPGYPWDGQEGPKRGSARVKWDAPLEGGVLGIQGIAFRVNSLSD
jgi:hypothetical protein